MTDAFRNYDQWLTTPPDEPEAIICEDCGQEEDIIDKSPSQGWTKCNNPICPGKHQGIAKEMAEKLIELQQDVDRLKSEKKRLEQNARVHKSLLIADGNAMAEVLKDICSPEEWDVKMMAALAAWENTIAIATWGEKK